MNEFDRRAFVDNLRATKPPYKCPFAGCSRIYRSFDGIKKHISGQDHPVTSDHNFSASAGPLSVQIDDKSVILDDTDSWQLTQQQQQQNQKIFDFQSSVDGKIYKLNILQPLEISLRNTDPNAKPDRTLREIIQCIPDEKSSPPSPKILTLLEPKFQILTEFSPPKAPPMPRGYIKYIETPPEELDDEIEYDMDEEDYVWLSLINESRHHVHLPKILESHLERAMDFLEKNCHFSTSFAQSTAGARAQGSSSSRRSMAGISQPLNFDEDAVCCVCLDGECDNANAILFCDMCNLSVHQECYGVPYIPEGQWLCRRCQLSPSQEVKCVLCPNRGGAFKQTADGRWAHVVCAIWVPEVQFANTVFLEPMEGFERIQNARWRLTCFICKLGRDNGACIQCHKPTCYTAFHVTCAQSAGLYMRIESVQDVSPGGSNYTVRKTAFCDKHEPLNFDDPMATQSPADQNTRQDMREQIKNRIRKARRMLNQDRNSSPVVCLPTISKSRFRHLATFFKFTGKQEFLDQLICYWTLKRESRCGVPLLRRLQICQPKKSSSTLSQEMNYAEVVSKISYWKQVRRDLEKTRLLVELLRKREQRKRDIIANSNAFVDSCLKPLKQCFLNVIEKLSYQDDMLVFAKPVSDEEVPGYSSFIQHPMDLGTMIQKCKRGEYIELQDLRKDFDLMIRNCLKFNTKTPFFIKYAQKMRRESMPIWTEAEKEFEDACRKISTTVTSAVNDQEVALRSGSSPKLVKLTENFQEYIEQRRKTDESRQNKAQVARLLRPKTFTIASNDELCKKNVVKVKQGSKMINNKKISNKIVGQSDIRKFFDAEKPVLAQVSVGSDDDDNPLSKIVSKKVHLKKATHKRRASSSRLHKNSEKDVAFLETIVEDTVRPKAKKSSKIPSPSIPSSPPALSPAHQDSTPAGPSNSNKQFTSRLTQRFFDPQTSANGGNFGTFRDVNPTSPDSETDFGKISRNRKLQRTGLVLTSPAFVKPNLNHCHTVNSPTAKNDHSDTDREEDSALRDHIGNAAQSLASSLSAAMVQSPTSPPTYDFFDHLNFVWATCSEYSFQLPAVIIDPSSNDRPKDLPEPPEEICRLLTVNNNNSNSNSPKSRYLVLLFDQKKTWKWIEKRFLEPMFISNDFDRWKLLSPTKKSSRKVLSRAYKAAVDFRSTYTGEDPSTFSLSDHTFWISEDSDDDSSR